MNNQEGIMKKNIVWLVVLAVVVIFGLLLSNGWDKIVNETVDNMSTITGNFSCLPKKDGTPTDEENCAIGIRSSDGSYYALDISRIQDANTDLRADETIAATGFVLPAEAVVGTEWEQFAVSGLIKVNTLLRTR